MTTASGSLPVSPRRRALVHTLLAAWVALSSYAVCTQYEIWPFSPYAMYARTLTSASLTQFQVMGVTPGDAPRERWILADEELVPFNAKRLEIALRRLSRRKDHDALLARALRDVGSRYEALRVAGRHDGPRLAALRLYSTTWNTETGGADVDRPVRRILVREIAMDPLAAQGGGGR